MKVNSSLVFKTVYQIKNNHKNSRNVIIEHNIRRDCDLFETEKPIEKTVSVYRFKKEIPAKKLIDYIVQEKKIVQSSYHIVNFSENQLVYYSTNSEMPKKIKDLFKKLIALKKGLEEKRSEERSLVKEQSNLYKEQERARKNMEALANSKHSDKFLNKVLKIENELDSIKSKIQYSREAVKQAEREYSDFVSRIEL